MKLRSSVRRAYVVALLILSSATPESAAAGGALLLLGSLLHFIASGYLAKEKLIVSAGPYRFVRNPFYISNVLIDAGFALAASGLTLCAACFPIPLYFALFYLWIIPRRVRREEAGLLAAFGDAYDEYRAKVPRYVPNPFSRMPPRGAYAFANIVKNREVPRLINHLIIIPALLLSPIVKSRAWNDPVGWALGGSVVFGYAISTAFRLALRRKKSGGP